MKDALKRWPPLYKKAKGGKVLVWEIWVRGNVIHSKSGQEGGQMRETSDTIKSGKNIGRSNETSQHEQAISEAQSKFNKKLEQQGYVENREDALAGKVSERVEGGFFPMLAEKYSECKSDVVFPCYVQPKLDGMRAVFAEDGLYSRARKLIPAVRHIHDEIVRLGLDVHNLDGELYNHDLREEFEEIMSAIKRNKSTHPKLPMIQYHLYDIFDPKLPYSGRLEELRQLRKEAKLAKSIKFVETKFVRDEAELMEAYEHFMEQGYEGAIIRNAHGLYENRRTVNLQKVKMMDDSEFRIVGIEEGRGSLQGHVGKFICVYEDPLGVNPKKNFRAKLKGKGVTKFLKECWNDHSLWEGKWLQVQYFGITKAEKVPRHPVGVKIRDID